MDQFYNDKNISGSIPFTKELIDNFGRKIDYLRIAVTDRCNLRCTYCMPQEGLQFIPHEEILRFEELERLVKIFAQLGISKLRVTGGEPFVRKGLMGFLERISGIVNLKSLNITTNGILTRHYVAELKKIGIAGINFSLDTLRKDRFFNITHREGLESVKDSIFKTVEAGIKVKINTVIQSGINEDEIVPITEIARKNPVEIRFIEEMPFNGHRTDVKESFDETKIIQMLAQQFPNMVSAIGGNSTAKLYSIPGFIGNVGVIGGYSRSFCDSCSRIRVTSRGMLKTCLYDGGVLDLKKMLREDKTDEDIIAAIFSKVQTRFENGFEAEQHNIIKVKKSMAFIGG